MKYCVLKQIQIEECDDLDCRYIPVCFSESVIDTSHLDEPIEFIEDGELESDYIDIDEEVVYGEEEFDYTDETDEV